MRTHTKTNCLALAFLFLSAGAVAQSHADASRHYEMVKTVGFPNVNVDVRDGALVVTQVFTRIDGSLPELKTGDIVRRFGHTVIAKKRDWDKAQDGFKPGDAVDISVERAGKELTIRVVLESINVFKEVV
jgi:S1-C subfamily serine protease